MFIVTGATRAEKDRRFAVAVPGAKDGRVQPLRIIETYDSKEELDKGYVSWRKFGESRGLTEPYKVELVGSKECRILD